jgi:sarcosine oxidase subunit alpha
MKTVCIMINGHALAVPATASVAAAVAVGAPVCFRRSVRGEPRAPLCGMGVCFECRVRINGTPHVRACMTPVRDGMQVDTDD